MVLQSIIKQNICTQPIVKANKKKDRGDVNYLTIYIYQT